MIQRDVPFSQMASDLVAEMLHLKVGAMEPKVERIFAWFKAHVDEPRVLHVNVIGKQWVPVTEWGIDSGGPFVTIPMPMDRDHEHWCDVPLYWRSNTQRFECGGHILIPTIDFEPGSIQAPLQSPRRRSWRW